MSIYLRGEIEEEQPNNNTAALLRFITAIVSYLCNYEQHEYRSGGVLLLPLFFGKTEIHFCYGESVVMDTPASQPLILIHGA